jgi:oligosaccharide repeat unit polymerase
MLNIDIYLYIVVSSALSMYFFKLIKYKFFTIRGIALTYFTIFYPLIMLLVVIDSIVFRNSMKIDPTVIINTLSAYIVFIIIFIVVELLFRTKRVGYRKHSAHHLDLYNGRAMLFILFFIIAFIIRINFNLYYHVSIDPDYNTYAAMYQSVINRLHWLGLLPVFLMQYKYFRTGKKIYSFISILLAILMIVLYIPSGSRTTAFLFLPILMIYILTEMKKNKLLFMVIGAILISVLVIFSGKLRVLDKDYSDQTLGDDIGILVHRLADSVVTGKIIEKVPSEYNYRNFNNMDKLLYTPFPSFIRSMIGVEVNFLDGVQYIWDIGLAGSWTSVPVTLLGDFYSRFSWYGVIIFSFILSIFLKFLDNIISKRNKLFSLVFLTIYSVYTSQIYIVDLQVLFVTITREFIIAYILSYIIVFFISKKRLSRDGG